MPRTLLVSEIFPPQHGGSGRWFWEIYRRLPRDQYVLLVGENPAQQGFDATHDLKLFRAKLAMSQWGMISLTGLRGYARQFSTVRSIVRREKIDRLHVGRCLPEGWTAYLLKLLTGLPYICYVHGEDIETAACSREHAFMVRRVLRGADRLIANSQNSARLIREGWHIADDRISVLHPGCDTTRFVPSPRSAEIRRQLGWNDRPVLLTVGRLQQRKGQDVLIRSLTAIRNSVPDVLYAIVGNGEERETLERLAQAEGVVDSVQFVGDIQDEQLIRCYQQCDLFVLPNRQVGRDVEGFGMVLVEAQACGRPVIAGASGGTRETMSPGETGYVVPCETPAELAPRIGQLLLDPVRRDTMGRAARAWAVSRFDWVPLTRQAQQIFDGRIA